MSQPADNTKRGTGNTKRFVPFLLAIVSGILLHIAFPPNTGSGEPTLAWFALAPFLATLPGASRRQGFRLGFLAGLAFWLPSISWLWALIHNNGPWPLVILGHFGLSAYCALYTGVFGLLLAGGQKKPAKSDQLPVACDPSASDIEKLRNRQNGKWRDARAHGAGIARALGAAVAWTGLEWVRSTFLTGFAWNHVGVSQYGSLTLVQLASLGGVCALSFLIVFVNAAVANVAVRIVRSFRRLPAPKHHIDLMVALLALLVAIVWGSREANRWVLLEHAAPPLGVSGAEPNAPSVFERGRDTVTETLTRLRDRTQFAASLHPDLIVWPETVLPGPVPMEPAATNFAFGAARACKAPVLAGTVEIRPGARDGGRDLIANASWLFGPDNKVRGTYRKQHLVPFGEFIPLDNVFPILESLSPIGYSCTSGEAPGLFPVRSELGRTNVVVSPLICFEDTVAPLASSAVRAGADLLVNQTNDAWFEGSAEPIQHHAQAVFRAVETRTPLVRVSNAGVSGVIAASGTPFKATSWFYSPVYPRQPDWPLSPYARHGDWLLAIPCAILVALWAAVLLTLRFHHPKTK